ncbi:hypothetical protein LILPANDA_129 [Klebsiella phage vB_KaeM_LilPanda]|nr:hypothetical protein LILPANDA_129 [Klebsiella phage vB_KaeM_LilPanda]
MAFWKSKLLCEIILPTETRAAGQTRLKPVHLEELLGL